MKRPPDYSRRVLLLATGMSPQVVTETVYALATQPEPFVPTEVHVVTTAEGAREARLTLIVSGWFNRLCEAYDLHGIDFGEHSIHVATGPDGRPLSDIRSAADNDAVANFITDKVRLFTADSEAALHVSMAGGRKTMGFFMGYALSLFGREQDRLSHVLVNEPFEGNRAFFFPTRESQTVPVRDSRHADARDAVVMLADIPFVILRHGYREGLLDGTLTYLQAVSSVRPTLGAARLLLHAATREVEADGQRFALPPWQFSLIACLALRARRGERSSSAPLKDVHDTEWAQRFIADLREVFGEMNVPDQVLDSVQKECTGNKIAPHMSHLRKSLEKRLGERAYLYISRKRARDYAVPLEARAIGFMR